MQRHTLQIAHEKKTSPKVWNFSRESQFSQLVSQMKTKIALGRNPGAPPIPSPIPSDTSGKNWAQIVRINTPALSRAQLLNTHSSRANYSAAGADQRQKTRTAAIGTLDLTSKWSPAALNLMGPRRSERRQHCAPASILLLCLRPPRCYAEIIFIPRAKLLPLFRPSIFFENAPLCLSAYAPLKTQNERRVG
jgi:hypothetical protein